VPDPSAALAEVKRVLRPQGWLLLLEHVRGEASWLRTLTNALDRPWHRFTQSCHLNRDTAAVVASAGLRVVSIFPFWGGLFQIIVARKPE
jgi:SAM-dependent methyltransferase